MKSRWKAPLYFCVVCECDDVAGTLPTSFDKKWIKFSRQICESNLSDLIKQIIPVDIVLVEGFKLSEHKKVEVVNSISERKPLHETDKTICGLIFDQHKIQNTVLPQFERDDIQKICDFIETTLGVE